jgi:hypothetical protein
MPTSNIGGYMIDMKKKLKKSAATEIHPTWATIRIIITVLISAYAARDR